MGFLGILEDHKLSHVPATTFLDEHTNYAASAATGLKHGTASFHILFCGLLNAGLFVIAAQLNKPIGTIALISGYQLLVAGSTGVFTAALSRNYGKRPVFLVSALFGFISSIIGSATHSYNGLLAARIIQGGSTAAYEGIIISMGRSVSMFANVITGPITTNLGWKYLFHLCVLFTGLEMLLVFFFVPETQYNRDQRLNIDETLEGDLLADKLPRSNTEHVEGETTAAGENAQPAPPKKTYFQQLAVYTGTYTSENLLQLVIAPFVAQCITLAQIFSPPPYLLSPTGVGNLFLGPFIGCIIATVVVGTYNDIVIRACARKNRGVYEPEYRLLLTAVGLTAGAGLMVFGYLCERKVSMYGVAAAFGLNMFGITAINITVCSYGLDAYREMSSDVFVAAIIFKNFLFYGFSWFVNNWVAGSGPAYVFYVFGGITFGLLATTPIVYVFGKRYRSFWARHNVLEFLKIKRHPEE